MPPLPDSLPIRPDSGPPFRRPPSQDQPDDPAAAPLARLLATIERRRQQAADERAAYESARDAAIRARRRAPWHRNA